MREISKEIGVEPTNLPAVKAIRQRVFTKFRNEVPKRDDGCVVMYEDVS